MTFFLTFYYIGHSKRETLSKRERSMIECEYEMSPAGIELEMFYNLEPLDHHGTSELHEGGKHLTDTCQVRRG